MLVSISKKADEILSLHGTFILMEGDHINNKKFYTWLKGIKEKNKAKGGTGSRDMKMTFKTIFNIYLFLRETETEWEGVGAKREGGTESAAGSRLRAVSTEPNAGFKLMSCEILTWAEVGCSTDWATQAPPWRWHFK